MELAGIITRATGDTQIQINKMHFFRMTCDTANGTYSSAGGTSDTLIRNDAVFKELFANTRGTFFILYMNPIFLFKIPHGT